MGVRNDFRMDAGMFQIGRCCAGDFGNLGIALMEIPLIWLDPRRLSSQLCCEDLGYPMDIGGDIAFGMA